MSICSISCWGCYKSECHVCQNAEEHDQKIAEMESNGWRKRMFGPTASPWFCSEECATNSPNAIRAAKLWRTEWLSKVINLVSWLLPILYVLWVIGSIVLR